MNFTGKTAFVTGAARGIGQATAVGFAKNGANVIIADISDMTETYEEVKKFGFGNDVFVTSRIAVYD